MRLGMPSPHRGKSRPPEWPDDRVAELKALWLDGGTISSIARDMGKTRGAVSGKSMRLHLHFASRHQKPIKPGSDADIYATTRFPNHVQPSPDFGVLKPGGFQRKLGNRVEKGPWKGMRIWSLTLEERATCPRTCRQWLSCYGNHMGRSVRYAHGVRLVHAIYADLCELQRLNPRGFVVRLHILGDFWSLEYVQFWRHMLAEFPALRVFGYTARLSGPIAEAIETLRDEVWSRFAVRSSGAVTGPRTKVISRPNLANGAIICPAQTGKTECCATCGLCWAPAAKFKPIAFLEH